MAESRVTTKVKFEILEKKLNKLFKKLRAIGADYTFTKDREFVRDVPVYAVDDNTGRTSKVDEIKVECVEFTVDFEPYRVGNYHVAAVLEKTASGENLVYTLDDTIDFKSYANEPLRCDHCNTRHNRKKAVVILDDTTGDEKMVGTACLHDYMGYNVETFASYFYDIQQMLLEDEDPYIMDGERGLYKAVVDVKEYLAFCIKEIILNGYKREVTKQNAFDEMRHNRKLSTDDLAKAREVIDFFEKYEPKDGFEHDTRMFVTGRSPIYGENGFVAFAYVLYTRIKDKIAEEQRRKEQSEKSSYYGEVGDKIDVIVTGRCVGHYENMYGTVWIYRFVDDDGHVFIWKTSSSQSGWFQDNPDSNTMTHIDGDRVHIKGTIKSHDEYNGEKQTNIIRVKILGRA